MRVLNDCIIPVDTSCRLSMCARCDRRGVRMRRIPGMAALGRVGRSRSWLVGKPPSPERDIKRKEKSHAWVLDEDAIQSTFDRSTRCPWRYRHGPVMRLSGSCGRVGDGEGGRMSDTRDSPGRQGYENPEWEQPTRQGAEEGQENEDLVSKCRQADTA